MTHGNREQRGRASVFARHQSDVLFALAYLVDEGRGVACLADAVNVEPGGPWCPLEIALYDRSDEPWPIAKVWESQRAELVERAVDGYGGLPRLPTGARLRALVVPIELTSSRDFAGVLVMGLNALLELDAMHRDFVEQVTTEIAKAVTSARACEERLLQKRAEEALRESETLKAFLLKLSDAIRSLSDAGEIQDTVTHTVMNHFAADRCYYCEIEGDRAVIRRDAATAALPSVTGVYPLGSFRIFKAALDTGQPLVVPDTSTSEFLDEDLRQPLSRLRISSFLAVPVIKDDVPVGVLSITQCERRDWTPFDVRVAIETAERTWAAVERGRAEVALRESEARLRESARRKDEFLAMLGHELRNPLAAIRSSAEIMKLIATDDSRLERIQRVLDRQSTHMSRLIDGLLEISRIVRGKVQLIRETCDAREIALGVLLDRRSQLQARDLELTEDLPSEPVWIHADSVRVAQILDNLIGNAIKFTPPGGSIDLNLGEEGGSLVMRVRDTGIGLSPDAMVGLFEPFQQGNREVDRSCGGLGLGLALAKRLVELHGGSIEASSDGPGTGAQFQVRLPLCAGPHETRTPEPATRVASRRILVVEDNTDAGESLRDLLKLLGHEVHLVPTGHEALAALRHHKPDVVFCDLGLPGMSGFDVARTIRSSGSLAGVQLVAVSGYGQPEDRKKTQQAGFDAHLVKPVDIQKVNETLRSLASRSSTH